LGNNRGKQRRQEIEQNFLAASALSREQLQADYERTGSLSRLGELYDIQYWRARELLVNAGVEVQKQGSNGANKSEAWHEAQRRFRETETFRAAQAKGRESYRNNPEMREPQRQMMIKRYEDPAEREKQAEIARRLWDDPNQPLYHWDREGHREQAKQRMLQLLKNTPLYPYESIVATYLDEIGIEYDPHYIDTGHEIDLFIPSCNLDIEIDGLAHTAHSARVHDAKRDTYHLEKGYRTHRITHASIDNNSFIPTLHQALNIGMNN